MKYSFLLAGMQDQLKNRFQLKEKLLPLVPVDHCLRKLKKMVPTSQKISFIYSSKENGLYQPGNLFPVFGMKDFFEKYFCTILNRLKKTVVGISEKWRKNWFPLAVKFVSYSRNKLPLPGKFLKNWILPDFNNGFLKQKESSKIRFLVGLIGYFLKPGFPRNFRTVETDFLSCGNHFLLLNFFYTSGNRH